MSRTILKGRGVRIGSLAMAVEGGNHGPTWSLNDGSPEALA